MCGVEGWIAIFDVVVRVSLIEKGTCEQRIEEGKGVSRPCILGKSIIAKRSASTRALRRCVLGMFEK